MQGKSSFTMVIGTLTKSQVNSNFLGLKLTWRKICVGDSIQFFDGKSLKFGNIIGKWGGRDKRLVVLDIDDNIHYLRNLVGVSVFMEEHCAYVPATVYGYMRK